MRVCITFDPDCIDYERDRLAPGEFDGFLLMREEIRSFDPSIRCTIFVRADRRVRDDFGSASYFFDRYAAELSKLESLGDEIGWHYHAFTQSDGEWRLSRNVSEVVSELLEFGYQARERGCVSCRLGWGYQEPEFFSALDELGFELDSSAIPRPSYKWSSSPVDWSITSSYPYRPSRTDFRVSGPDSHAILEVPITTFLVHAPYDEGEVVRYANLAFFSEALSSPLREWCEAQSLLVTITHPYELLPSEERNGLISHSMAEFKRNLSAIRDSQPDLQFITLHEILKVKGEQ